MYAKKWIFEFMWCEFQTWILILYQTNDLVIVTWVWWLKSYVFYKMITFSPVLFANECALEWAMDIFQNVTTQTQTFFSSFRNDCVYWWMDKWMSWTKICSVCCATECKNNYKLNKEKAIWKIKKKRCLKIKR